jgi:hypothetical protein
MANMVGSGYFECCLLSGNSPMALLGFPVETGEGPDLAALVYAMSFRAYGALDSGSKGRRFKSSQARHDPPPFVFLISYPF